MEPRFPNKNSSNLIKLREEMKRQARRRLIGSIFLLLLALTLLLYVTAKIKPIAINPEAIEIRSHNSLIVTTPIPNISASSPQSTPIKENAIVSQYPTQQKESTAHTQAAANSHSHIPTLKGQIISEQSITQTTPEDILDANTTQKKSSKYFIQLTALSDKQKISSIQHELTTRNIKTFILPNKTTKGVIYRLRMGPFNTKEEAAARLTKLNTEELL